MTATSVCFSSSNDTVNVWALISVVTLVTPVSFSTAARAVLAVPPQTTPGVDSSYETVDAKAAVEIRVPVNKVISPSESTFVSVMMILPLFFNSIDK